MKMGIQVFGNRLEARELNDGYDLAFPANGTWHRRLGEFSQRLRSAHPDLAISVRDDGNDGRLWLRIQGPSGTKPFVENAMRSSSVSRRQLGWTSRVRRSASWRYRRLTAPLRTLPDFLIIGAARCGTTSLFMYLAQHPSTVTPASKEIGFFDRQYRRGERWYRAHFPTVLAKPLRRDAWVTGEATPEYLFNPHAPARVRAIVPDAKLIVLLRDPVARAHSHYQLKVGSGYEKLSFEDAVESEDERLRGELDRTLKDADYVSERRSHYSYLSRGIYADQLASWFELFPREQMLVLSAEAFNRDRPGVFRRVIDFLGIPPSEPERFDTFHTVPRREMDPATKAGLAEYFEPHNRRLYALVGEDFGWEAP